MISDWYSHTTVPATSSSLSSATMRAELESIETGVSAKLPDLAGAANRVWYTNSGGTAATSLAAFTFDGTTLLVPALTLSGALSVLDSNFSIKDNADNTKIAQFQASGITTGTTKTFTLPDANDTVAVLAAAQALTNKTYNGNTFTAGTGTLTIAAAKTLTANNSLTLAGTDATVMTFPATSATIARTDAANTFTGVQTMTSPAITTPAFTGAFSGVYSLGGTPTINIAAAVGGTWTAAATWTLPALTLGGTVSGGGNQLNNVVIGAVTPLAGTFTTGIFGSTTSLLLGTAGSAVGNIGFRNATSGTATVAPPTGALGTYTVTLPNSASTLPIYTQQITYTGPTAARTITLPDAAFTVARTDAANTFTGTQTFSNLIAAAAGAVGAPSIYLGGDTTSGLYRIGANNHGYAISAAKVLDIAAAGLAVTGTLSATSTFNVTGVGPHAIGGATVAIQQVTILGAFTSTTAVGLVVSGTKTATAGDAYGIVMDSSLILVPAVNSSAVGAYISATMNKAGSGTHPEFVSMFLAPPTIGAGAAVLTNASTLKITGAPTVGTNKYSAWIIATVAGDIRLDSSTANGTVATALGSLGPAAAQTTVQTWLTVNIAGTVRYIPCF